MLGDTADATLEIAGLPGVTALDARGRRLFEYWREKRGARKMPCRADLEPGDIPDLLPDIALVDVFGDAPYLRYRLVGTRQVAARGLDPTGKPVSEGHLGRDLPGMREQVISNYRRVIESGRPLFRDTSIAGHDNRGDILLGGRLIARFSLFLPLSAGGETVDMILVYSRFEDG
ncbi:MAG: PAS domain-containing protein [Tagaea sp.]|nr:PAS domain-containing protein [Tagaea sp.]